MDWGNAVSFTVVSRHDDEPVAPFADIDADEPRVSGCGVIDSSKSASAVAVISPTTVEMLFRVYFSFTVRSLGVWKLAMRFTASRS